MNENPILTMESLKGADARIAALTWRLPDNLDPSVVKVAVGLLAEYLDEVGDKFGYFSDEHEAVVERLVELADRDDEADANA